jgi:hypothetical protein
VPDAGRVTVAFVVAFSVIGKLPVVEKVFATVTRSSFTLSTEVMTPAAVVFAALTVVPVPVEDVTDTAVEFDANERLVAGTLTVKVEFPAWFIVIDALPVAMPDVLSVTVPLPMVGLFVTFV